MGKLGKGKPQNKRRATRLKPYSEPEFIYMFDKNPASSNNPVKKGEEEQFVPKSLKKLMTSIKMTKEEKQPKQKPAKEGNKFEDKMLRREEKGMTRPVDPIPDFTRLPYESDNQYKWRVQRQTKEVVAKSKLEAAYNIKIHQDEEGAPVIKYAEPLPPSKKKAKAKQRAKDKKAKKKDKSQMKKDDKLSGFEHLQDKVSFGERVDAPPTLTAKPRKASMLVKSKPGQKSLKLKELLAENSRPGSSTSRKPGESVKKKDISAAKQKILDEERERAISLYRKLKHRQAKAVT